MAKPAPAEALTDMAEPAPAEALTTGIALGEATISKRLRDRKLVVFAMRILLVTAFLAFWQIYVDVTDSRFWFSAPSEIWGQLTDWISSGYLQQHLWITVQEMLLGLLFGASTGIIAGFILGLSPTLARILDPIIMALYSLPKLALAPLFVLWFGIGIVMKTVLTATIVFFLVFYNTYAGVRDRDAELIDVLRVMGARRHHVIRKVVLPGAMSYVYVGLKLAIPYALIGAVIGEIIASNRGLGFVLMSSAGAFNTKGIFAVLFVLMVISSILNTVLNRTEERVLRWKLAGR
jgi:NitT/TauT family transport system permease protein